MKIFNIDYNNKEYEGIATIEASNASKAIELLQSIGRLNASRYNCTSIIEVGCNDSLEERIVSERFYPELKSEDNSSNPEPIEPVEPIIGKDYSSLETLLGKYKVNNYPVYIKDRLLNAWDSGSRTLTVDNIRLTKRPNPDDGYLVYRHSKNSLSTTRYQDEVLLAEKKDSSDRLFIVYNKTYINIPIILLNIHKIVCANSMLTRQSDGTLLKESLKKKKYGIFVLRKGSYRKAHRIRLYYNKKYKLLRGSIIEGNANYYSFDTIKEAEEGILKYLDNIKEMSYSCPRHRSDNTSKRGVRNYWICCVGQLNNRNKKEEKRKDKNGVKYTVYNFRRMYKYPIITKKIIDLGAPKKVPR